ncbi:hypothetical protein K1719_035245 [Acacia pycnantha]|nr:hypothetical protein K1719_035245 [Acacia pycnantha]
MSDLSVKGSSPPLTKDDLRSTKKVCIRPEGGVGSGGVGESDTVRKESVTTEESDTVMKEAVATGEASYRNNLLNLDRMRVASKPLNEVALSDNDYRISRESDIPSIEFTSRLKEVLVKGIECTVVLKLLGKSISYRELLARTQSLWQPKGTYQLIGMEGGFHFVSFDLEEDYMKALTGGPWMIFGAYLMVQPWALDFDCRTSMLSKVIAWVRIPGLSFRYYHKSTLRVIGALLGEVVKIDYLTESRGRGRYARLAILIDLQKSLVPWIKVDGMSYGVEYEGLPHIFFNCGKYGHTQERCSKSKSDQDPARNLAASQQRPDDYPRDAGGSNPIADVTPESPPALYGSWMQDLGNDNPQSVGEESCGQKGFALKDKVSGILPGKKVVQKDKQAQKGSSNNRSTLTWAKKTVEPKEAQAPDGKAVVKVDLNSTRMDHSSARTAVHKEIDAAHSGMDLVAGEPSKESVGTKEDTSLVGTNTSHNSVVGESSKAAEFLSSAFKAMETSSSLDSSKHTVVTIPSFGQALEEVNKMFFDDRFESKPVAKVSLAAPKSRQQPPGISRCVRWAETFGLTCWKLLDSRNKALFQNLHLQPSTIAQEVRRMVDFSEKAAVRVVEARGGGVKQTLSIAWLRPPPMMACLNCDGSRGRSEGGAGAG